MHLAVLRLRDLGMPDLLCRPQHHLLSKPFPSWKKKKHGPCSKGCLCALLCFQAGQGNGGILYTDSHPHTFKIARSAVCKTKRVLPVSQHGAEALLGILHEDSFVSPLNHAG